MEMKRDDIDRFRFEITILKDATEVPLAMVPAAPSPTAHIYAQHLYPPEASIFSHENQLTRLSFLAFSTFLSI
jgi:hypothetical protein